MDDDDAKLKAEIEAELDKLSISSLEKEDIESDSKSETQSDDSDTDSVELPESVLHCINIIKNRSKAVEELILQDLEDTDILSRSYGAVSNNHMHLRTGLSTEYEESSEQLIKILSEIEKEEFMRSKTNCASPDFVPEPIPHDLPMDEHVLPDDADINFGYCEVEEKCRQSFEAWQEKQKELENKEKETLKAQRDREEKQFQEEEEKRHCWMKQFKVEKKKLENIQKQEQDKMNDELYEEEKIWKEKFKQHEEYIRNLHLQMEEERTRFKDQQEKEKNCLLKQQNNAAVKIQAKYKAFVAYQKYGPIIKEQIESRKRKAQEWKEKEAKIRQKEEENRKRLEEEQRIKEERKKQKEEERKRREKEYEDKKNIMKQKREQLIIKENIRLREDASQQLIISSALKKRGYNNKHLSLEDISNDKGDIAKNLVDENLKKQEDVLLWLAEESNMKENIDRQTILKESIQVQLKESISSQTILADFKMEEKNKNLAKKQCSEEWVKQERKSENVDNKTELGDSGLKGNLKEQFPLQELKSDAQKEEIMKHVINENMGPKTQIILEHNQEINEVKTKEAQKIIKDNQQKKIQKVEKEEIQEQNGLLYKDKDTLIISMKQKSLSLTSENSEDAGENVILREKEIYSKVKEIEENPKDNAWNSGIVIFNTTDTMINKEGKRNNQDYVLGRHAPCEDLSDCNAESSMVSKEVNSLKSEIRKISEKCPENGPEPESMTCSVPESTLLYSIEEKRLAWIKSFKPWLETFKQNQQKKIVRRKRPVKCPANMTPALDKLEILRCGPWDTLQQVTTVTFQDLPGCVLSTLAECTNLQFLSLQRCGLTSLHSLSNCKKLKYIDAQENRIEAIDCENLENLCVVLLNKNQLTSLHGLDGCTNIQCLELSHNKITRIGYSFFLEENLVDNTRVCHHLGTSASYLSLTQVWIPTGLCWSQTPITSLTKNSDCNFLISHLHWNCGLESLKNLQQLILDHNQLISTKGLCDTPTVVYLDCSHNHLTDVEGIENCGLLQILKLQGNYLSELPSLENLVLLRELHLDDNSISTVEAFSSYWLPLLQNLTVSQNSLTKIVPLFHFVSLEKLDVSHNCLSDLKSVMKWFDACYSLRELSLTGNPLLQETNWRDSLLKVLPDLRILNGNMLNSDSKSHTEEHNQLESAGFLALCQSQIREFSLLTENYITGKGDVFTLDTAENLCHYFKKLMILSTEYRHAHERGDVNITKKDESEAQKNHLAPTNSDSTLQNGVFYSCAHEDNPDSPDNPEKWMDSVSSHSPLSNFSTCENMERRHQEILVCQKKEDSKASSIPTIRIPLKEVEMTNSVLRNHQNIEPSEKIMAAVVIQSYWRGYLMRRQIHFSTRLCTAATEGLPNSSIKNQTILKKEKRENIVNIQKQREKAAVLIQAVWKGFILRKKLTAALQAIKNEESDEEYREIDLEDFTFDEAALEEEWLASDSTRFPSQTLLLSNQLHWPKIPGNLKWDDTSFNLPSNPAQAWLCNDKENLSSSEHTQLSGRSENRTSSWTLESKTSRKSLLKSEKEKKISEEWGFKDISTAQQMLKRAQKMQSKKLKKKIDSTVRLSLFKNNENKVSVPKSSKKVQPRRDGYFEGIEEDPIHKDTTANEKLERNREYTYQWLHTQVEVHGTTSSRNMKCNHFLPELDPDVLNGGRVQLVARRVSREDTDLDLLSMTSGSALSVKRGKKNQAHRHSAGSSSKLWFPSKLI
ncbi:PREDICTED: LOW QUALITY PROTEIN: leucine-rich repeat and IQ domain-containing protein 1 [Colobus angolensis palliatus]|uniref:LOW QUALITY PROTEIN: leucine-rich repeat and IQ domain-containing protein 1 n=1 Tax=Colobus angolensis palliatus TaxID=336983 RepID=UPI0005F45FE5|nr:PREDICTED: LOW QUALITY PROTEIN: leucine-rich repeat and IQ domain-containing protein 1 [Colobus angolensis palliatus]